MAAAAAALLTSSALNSPSAEAAATSGVDVLFVFDTTGSMGGALAEAKAQVTDAIASVRQRYPDSDFGLATVGDYDPGDTPWALKQKITADPEQVQAAVDPLTANGGGDSPEAYGRALYEAAHNSGVGWRDGARHILILVNDDVPHDNDLDEGVPADIQNQPAPWDTGVDPGPDGAAGTADDVDWQAQLAALKSAGIIFATVFYSGSETYQPYWDWWTKQTGGSTTIGGGDTALGDILAQLIDDSVSGGAIDPLDPAAWSAGDVHVHSTGDTSLRDNLLCRHKVAGFPASGSGTITAKQEQDCATYLVDRTLNNAHGNGLSWVILSEHGVWLGVQAPGAKYLDYRRYSETEARAEWNTIRTTASGRAAAAKVRALIGEEIGSAPPITFSGHFSSYSASDYIKDGPFDVSEGRFLQSVKGAGAFGAINHPGTGSTWGCWYESDQTPIYVNGRKVGTKCSDGVAEDFPDQVRALEVYTGAGRPIANVLARWDGLLNRGAHVAAVGGGDTHSVKRCGFGDVTGSACRLKPLGDQVDGNGTSLGADGQARTWVLAGGLVPAAGFNSNDPKDPVRGAIRSGTTLASNGPVAGVALDGKAPTADSVLPYSESGHKLEVSWNSAQAKAGGARGTYGDPTAIRLVIGQIVDGKFKADCGNPRNPYRHSDCTSTITVLGGKRKPAVTTAGSTRKLTYTVPGSAFRTFRVPGPAGYSVQYTPAAFARVEIDFTGQRGVYSSPFYLQGAANQIPNF